MKATGDGGSKVTGSAGIRAKDSTVSDLIIQQ